MKHVASALIAVALTVGVIAVLNRTGMGRQVLGS